MSINLKRFCAFLIDSTLIVLTATLMNVYIPGTIMDKKIEIIYDETGKLSIFTKMFYEPGYIDKWLYIYSVTLATLILARYIFKVLVPRFNHGKSIGKHITGCRVITTNGKPLSHCHLIKRELVFVIVSIIVLAICFQNKDILIQKLEQPEDIRAFLSSIGSNYQYEKIGDKINNIILVIIGLSVFFSNSFISIGIHDRFSRTAVVNDYDEDNYYEVYQSYKKNKDLHKIYLENNNEEDRYESYVNPLRQDI